MNGPPTTTVCHVTRVPSLARDEIGRRSKVFRGSAGGDAFIDLVWDDPRAIPVIAISEDYGLVLHPGIVEAMSVEVAGLAVVAQLDSDASWRLALRPFRMCWKNVPVSLRRRARQRRRGDLHRSRPDEVSRATRRDGSKRS